MPALIFCSRSLSTIAPHSAHPDPSSDASQPRSKGTTASEWPWDTGHHPVLREEQERPVQDAAQPNHGRVLARRQP